MNIQTRGQERTFAVEPAADASAAPGRRRLWIAALVVLLLVAAGLVAFAMRGGAEPAAPASGAAGTAQRVTVIVPGHRAMSATVSVTGTLAAQRDMPVGVAGEGGRVTAVLVEAGQWVSAGQVLATIDRSVQTQQAAQLAASIRVAEADAALAQANLDRARSLVGRGFVSNADLDSRVATRDAARARVALARAQSNETRALIGRLDVRAPAAGLVLTRAVEPGQVVSGGSTALFRIARDGDLEVQARLAEQDLARLSVGRTAQVTPIGATRSFTGRIWQISPVIDPASRQGVARIALPHDPALRPGGFAAVTIVTGSVDAPMLPQSAVLDGDGGPYVYVVGARDVVIRRPVVLGDVSDAGVSIRSGLNGDERVVVSAGAFLNPGDVVVPTVRAAAR